MIKFISLYSITFLFTNIVIAQPDSLYISKFQTDLINTYSELSKVSKENYFQILSKAAEYTFTDQNPNYSKAILEISKSQNVNEEKALEKLFEYTFSALRKDFLWNSATGISLLDLEILNVYNESLCPCISSKVLKESPMEKVLEAQQACVPSLISDTVFLNRLKSVAGQNTLNDLYRLQRYLFLLIYEKCDLINYKFNGTILDNSVLTNYHQSISNRKRFESLNVVRLYESNQLDSLKIIFPSYNKYIPLLKEAVKSKNLKKNTIDNYYYGHMVNNSNPTAVLDMHDKDLLGISLTFTFSEHALNSSITSAKIKRFKKSKGVQKIMETRVISSDPKKN